MDCQLYSFDLLVKNDYPSVKKFHDLLMEFHDFSMTFQAWKIPFLNSMTFQAAWEPQQAWQYN